jgi:hypothetical protein
MGFMGFLAGAEDTEIKGILSKFCIKLLLYTFN